MLYTASYFHLPAPGETPPGNKLRPIVCPQRIWNTKEANIGLTASIIYALVVDFRTVGPRVSLLKFRAAR